MFPGIDPARPLGAIVIGRAGMDLYPEPDGEKTETAERFVSDVGGSAGNIAVALARQQICVQLLAPLSADPVGRFVRRTLARYGVDLSRCREVRGQYRTSLALAETRPDDSETVIYRNGAADFAFSAEDVDPPHIATAACLIVTGTALAAEPSRSGVLAALAAARKTGAFTALDIDHRPYSWATPGEARAAYREAAALCDAVVGTEGEFEILAGNGDALAAAAGLIKSTRNFAVMKRGEKGSLTLCHDGQFETGIYRVKARKPFGAGDAFMGGLFAALLKGSSLETAVARGSAAAALVVARRGCASAMPSTAEIEALLAREKPVMERGTANAHPAL